jgi:hypothetical protein
VAARSGRGVEWEPPGLPRARTEDDAGDVLARVKLGGGAWDRRAAAIAELLLLLLLLLLRVASVRVGGPVGALASSAG